MIEIIIFFGIILAIIYCFILYVGLLHYTFVDSIRHICLYGFSIKAIFDAIVFIVFLISLGIIVVKICGTLVEWVLSEDEEDEVEESKESWFDLEDSLSGNDKSSKDGFGNHSKVSMYSLLKSTKSHGIFELNKKYSKLDGYVSCLKDAKGKDGNGYLRIYGNGKLIYEIEQKDIQGGPKKFSINVRDVNYLEVIMKGGKEVSIMDAKVYK